MRRLDAAEDALGHFVVEASVVAVVVAVVDGAVALHGVVYVADALDTLESLFSK